MASLKEIIEEIVGESYQIDEDGKVKVVDSDSEDMYNIEEKSVKVDTTINLYHNFFENLEEAYQKVENIDYTLRDYSKEYRANQVDKIWQNMDEERERTGNKVLSIIDDRINEARKEQELRVRNTEHQLLVSNALGMLQMLDKNATEYQINNIIAPFIEKKDYQTLSVIKTYLDNKFPSGLLNTTIQEINFPTLIVSDEFRHMKMKELFKDIFFSNTAKYIINQDGLNREIAIRTIGKECGYYDIESYEAAVK